MNRCGCNPIQEPFEFKILENSKNSYKGKLQELFPIINNIDNLKDKIICEYLGIIDSDKTNVEVKEGIEFYE